ncbi:MAG: ribose transport system substrate-binding protein, partial [Subtercola sp.]|nr:ribose transport system substrate-binding protein [Subtercola sp.]
MAPSIRARRALSLGAAAVAITLAFAGCSASDDAGTAASSTIKIDTAFTADPAATQKLVNLAFGVDTPVSSLPAEAVSGFEWATATLTWSSV